MDVLRKGWENPEMARKSPNQFVEELNTQLKQASHLAWEDLGQTQQQQRKMYDEKVQIRVLQPGQKVLV